MFNANFAAPVLPLSQGSAAPGVFEMLATWVTRVRSRRALAKLATLDAHLRRDIGWSAHEIRREVAKPFWQA